MGKALPLASEHPVQVPALPHPYKGEPGLPWASVHFLLNDIPSGLAAERLNEVTENRHRDPMTTAFSNLVSRVMP